GQRSGPALPVRGGIPCCPHRECRAAGGQRNQPVQRIQWQVAHRPQTLHRNAQPAASRVKRGRRLRHSWPTGGSRVLRTGEDKKPMQRKNLLVAVGRRSQNVNFFIASCLLATVSWYTTEQGMGLFLSTWLALFASVGVQSALVFVAWRLGIATSKRGVIIVVYA